MFPIEAEIPSLCPACKLFATLIWLAVRVAKTAVCFLRCDCLIRYAMVRLLLNYRD